MVLDFGPEEDGGEGGDAAVQAERTPGGFHAALQSHSVVVVGCLVLLSGAWYVSRRWQM